MHFLENSMFVLNAYFCRELRFVSILRSKLRFLLRNTGVDSDFTQNFWGKNWRLKSLLCTLNIPEIFLIGLLRYILGEASKKQRTFTVRLTTQYKNSKTWFLVLYYRPIINGILISSGHHFQVLHGSYIREKKRGLVITFEWGSYGPMVKYEHQIKHC